MSDRSHHRPLRPSRLFAFVLAVACALAAAAPARAGPYLLVDADSGRVILQSDAGQPWFPASVTKLMTVYLAFRAMRDNRVESDTLLEVSAKALAQPPTKMGFKVGTEITLDNAIKMLMVRSANDIAVVVAEGISGSLEAFVHEMNMTAGQLGMYGTRFMNPHGLPDDNQVTTARDMAILARTIYREFPEYELYFRIPAIQLGKRVIRNHNRLIGRYSGAEGMKTGFICASGFNLVARAQRDGKRLIAVVFGAYSATQRAKEAALLLEYGFTLDNGLATLADYELPMLETLRNSRADPVDMRDEMCNRKRKRPVAESEIEDLEEEVANASNEGKTAATERKPLLGPLNPSMPPIRVFAGAPKKLPEVNLVAVPPERPKLPAESRPTLPVRAASVGGTLISSAQAADAGPAPSAKMPGRAPLPLPRPDVK